MHKRQRMILHAGLALAAGLLAWRLGTEWQRANLRYDALSRDGERSAAGSTPAAAAGLSTAQASPLPTEEWVAQNIFSADRTNEIAPTATTERQPPVPVVFGTMKLGANYEALMAEGGSPEARAFRRVKQGEQLGAYSVVEILDQKVVIEYGGQRTTLDIYQSARSVAPPPARTALPAPPVVVETGTGQSPGPAASQQGGAPARAPAAQQPGVRVTIEGNRRRLQRDTPFGVQTWYEPLEP